MPKALVTGAAGFIAGYLVPELLNAGWNVIGVDDYSKYGKIARSYDNTPGYEFHEMDVKNTARLTELAEGCDQIIAIAAKIGGIAYFHRYPYTIMLENEQIMGSTYEAARVAGVERVIVMSSSMVYESTDRWPSVEGDERKIPPPCSSYGLQKLACEYWARAALLEHDIPYTILRPFNCVGVGETRALGEHRILSGNVRMAMSHVVPDLVQKVLKGQDPLHILGDGSQTRCYTYGGDLAKGIVRAMTNPRAVNEDFNLSTPHETTVLELARVIWEKIHGDREFRWVSDAPFAYDVQRRIPDVAKAREVLGWEANTSLSVMLDEVIPWVQREIDVGRM